jgi:type VI protein secretion system component VasK
MRRNWRRMIWIAPLAILGILVFMAIGAEIVMLLWNWLLPPLFGWHQIAFWQALGILVLCRILFGGHGFRRGPRRDWYWRRRIFERWENMTPEEREKLRQRMRNGCGPYGSTAAEPKG